MGLLDPEKVFPQKKCSQQRLYEHVLDQRLCPLNGGVPSLILFKLYINQYVESWTVNLRRINNLLLFGVQ